MRSTANIALTQLHLCTSAHCSITLFVLPQPRPHCSTPTSHLPNAAGCSSPNLAGALHHSPVPTTIHTPLVGIMASASTEQPQTPFPPQHAVQEAEMQPRPCYIRDTYRGTDKLRGKAAIITGGDSGIGRAVAVHFAREGANVLVAYNKSHEDAKETQGLVEREGVKCVVVAGDVGSSAFCNQLVDMVVKEWGRLDVLVNNAAQQEPHDDITALDPQLVAQTFRTNIYSYIFLARAAWPHMGKGAAIINTTSVTAYKGHPQLLDYSSTKGAIVGFTRALSQSSCQSGKGVRVNAVAPGPIWTPLITATFPQDKVASFGKDTPMGRAGQPCEVAPAYVFLASEDSSYITGQVLHPNGGTIVNA